MNERKPTNEVEALRAELKTLSEFRTSWQKSSMDAQYELSRTRKRIRELEAALCEIYEYIEDHRVERGHSPYLSSAAAKIEALLAAKPEPAGEEPAAVPMDCRRPGFHRQPRRHPCGPTGDDMFCACGCGGDETGCPDMLAEERRGAPIGPPVSSAIAAKAKRANAFFKDAPEESLGEDPDYGLGGEEPKLIMHEFLPCDTPNDYCPNKGCHRGTSEHMVCGQPRSAHRGGEK